MLVQGEKNHICRLGLGDSGAAPILALLAFPLPSSHRGDLRLVEQQVRRCVVRTHARWGLGSRRLSLALSCVTYLMAVVCCAGVQLDPTPRRRQVTQGVGGGPWDRCAGHVGLRRCVGLPQAGAVPVGFYTLYCGDLLRFHDGGNFCKNRPP